MDLNGKTINNTVDIWADPNGDTVTDAQKIWSLISVKANGILTITGNGKVLAKANDVYAVDVRGGGKLVIENGEFVGNLHSIYVNKGTAEIKGGKYSITQLDTDKIAAGGNGHEFTLNLYDANGKNGTAKIIVTGGSFVNYDPSHSKSEAPEANFVATGYAVTSATVEGKTVYTVAMDAANISIGAYAEKHDFVNGKQYDTLDDINAVIVRVTDYTAVGPYSSNSGKFYLKDEKKEEIGNWRIYQNENPKIVITAKEGFNVTSVKITYTSAKTGVLLNGTTQVASGTVVNVTGNTITFGVGNTKSDVPNGNIQITSIEVVYAPAAPQA